MGCLGCYDVKKCETWIKEHSFTKIALQFSSDFVQDALLIARHLEELNVTTFVVAESQFSGCCADETIAEKANCDCLIHFGDCCHAATCERIPVLIIPRREPMDMEPLRSCLCKAVNDSTFNFAELSTLILDQRYAYLADVISNEFSAAVQTVEVSAGLTLPCNSTALFIGSESCRLNLLTLQNPTVRIYLYDPQTARIRRANETVNSQLRRRFVVGILIGSLTMKDRLKLLHRIREKAKLAKKKCYTFAINRVTPPKLANFPEVDIFVYIGCPYSSLIDNSEFYKPIISPFEFDLACNPMVSWNPVDGLLSSFGSNEEEDWKKTKDDCDVSLISGRIQACNFMREDESNSNNNKCDSIERQDFTVEKLPTAVSFYNERTWKGLEDKVTDQEVHPVSKGRDGWAMGYANEPD
ncbi:hypothetical protein M514_07448 [Trichuris suis]|uniref:Uncharacterized protein n=1 Tax=Trichuris suis TaxID=68888 RepID=A0A085NCE5_9BILA|nr:hypothetical protein M513_07448 [Trichuris suis]KFD67141.1 hypothetical protein M514_07448 [Trichuris suis]KHJ41452.1 hypothetical protein D918_08415 [Trichuris suis]